MNKWALAQLPNRRLEIVPGATHLVRCDTVIIVPSASALSLAYKLIHGKHFLLCLLDWLHLINQSWLGQGALSFGALIFLYTLHILVSHTYATLVRSLKRGTLCSSAPDWPGTGWAKILMRPFKNEWTHLHRYSSFARCCTPDYCSWLRVYSCSWWGSQVARKTGDYGRGVSSSHSEELACCNLIDWIRETCWGANKNQFHQFCISSVKFMSHRNSILLNITSR